jgi:hypothetical protein
MKVVANQRVYYKGTLYIKDDKFDVDDPKQDKVAREFLSCRAIRASEESNESVEILGTSPDSRGSRRYGRRDMAATEK